MAWRASFFWTRQAELLGGWSENFWMDGVDKTGAVAACTALRAEFFQNKGYGVVCPRFRLSDPAVFRSGFDTKVVGAVAGTGSVDFSADYVSTKWLLKMVGDTATVSQWYGGVEDLSVQFGALNRSSSGISVGFARIKALMTANAGPWRVRVLNPAVLAIPVQRIDPVTGLVTVGAHNYLTGQRVRVARINGLTDANGIWRVTVPASSTTTFSLDGWLPSAQVMIKSPSAQVRLQTYVYQHINDIRIERATSHKVGRPTQLLGGRRRKKKK